MTHARRRPARPTVLLKENGEMTKSPDEAVLRWDEHFNKILNIPSQYCQEVIDAMPVHWELDDPPTCEELWTALSKLRKDKAGGKTGILSELLVCGGTEMHDRLLKLMREVWKRDQWWRIGRMLIWCPFPRKET